jgi:farnesyl-diphosphate farnesyltransferase
LLHTGEIDPDVEKKKAEDSEAKKDVFFLLLAVIGTLLVISGLMVSRLTLSQFLH